MNTPRPVPYKVSLIGDDGLDEYHYGLVERLSAEAPVPIFNFKYSVHLPGMAANVKTNLEELNVDVFYHAKEPCRKIRMVDEKFKHHLLRVDHDVISTPLEAKDINLLVNAIVISDYNKGAVSYELIESLKESFLGPIFIDTKKTDLERLSAPHVYVKINEPESNKVTSVCENLIVTRGNHPVQLFKHGSLVEEFPVKDVPVFDVCGAGDTFLASLTYRFICTRDIHDAIQFASKAASLTVQHFGVYAPSLKEINET